MLLHAKPVVDLGQPETLACILRIDRLHANRLANIEVCLSVCRQVEDFLLLCIDQLQTLACVKNVKIASTVDTWNLSYVKHLDCSLGSDHNALLFSFEIQDDEFVLAFIQC